MRKLAAVTLISLLCFSIMGIFPNPYFVSGQDEYRVELGTPAINEYTVNINGAALPGSEVDYIEWDWGDGSEVAQGWFPNSHTYLNDGEYTITVTAYYKAHYPESAQITFEIPDGPTGGSYVEIISTEGGHIEYQSSLGSGTVDSSASMGLYLAGGNTVDLSAVADYDGFLFSYWSVSDGVEFKDGFNERSNPVAVVLNGDLDGSVTANFGYNLRVPDDYDTINYALSYANFGDTISVSPGLYEEDVEIYQGISLVGLGDNPGDTIIQGSISVQAENVQISNLKVENTLTPQSGTGIYLDSATNVVVANNEISDFDVGIYLYSSGQNQIEGNTLTNNVVGILLEEGSTQNSIVSNQINNEFDGTEYLGDNGILISYSDENVIVNNNIVGAVWEGIFVEYSGRIRIISNTVKEAAPAVSLSNAFDCEICFNNFIENREPPFEEGSDGIIWDGGYPYGGNFWGESKVLDEFKGSNQDIPGVDGILDQAFDGEGMSDNYPLAAPSVASIESCNLDGVPQDSFMPLDSIYVYGRGFMPLTTYQIYVVVNIQWTDGLQASTLTRVAGSLSYVTTDESGRILCSTVALSNAVPGEYDIFLDVNENGQYDLNIDPLDDNDIVSTAGLLVVPEYAFGGLLGLVTCFAAFIVIRRKQLKPHLI